jgi:hypothetical protein
MSGRPGHLTATAVGAALVVTGTALPCAAGPTGSVASSTAVVATTPTTPDRTTDTGAASRSLPGSARLVVPPLRYPGVAASQRVARLPAAGTASTAARPTERSELLPDVCPLWRRAVWEPPALPWS